MTEPLSTPAARGLPLLRNLPYLVLRLSGSVVALATLLTFPSGEHVLQQLWRYGNAAGLEDLVAELPAADAQVSLVAAAIAPWVSASLVLCLLLAVAADGRARHALASAAALILGPIAYCPPIQPLAWLLLLAVFVVPADFVFRGRGFADAGGRLLSAALAVVIAILWLLVWPELLRRAAQNAARLRRRTVPATNARK